jgi:predicted DNA-binding transcriptional regulator AlpA
MAGGVAVLRRKEVLARLGGISNSTLYAWIKAGIVPPPRKAAPNTQVAYWLESDIEGVLRRLTHEALAEAG